MTPRTASRPAAAPAAPGPLRTLSTTPDSPVLADAVARVRELSLRLWAVRAAHPPVRVLLGRVRCRTCGAAYPCPTVRATAGLPAS